MNVDDFVYDLPEELIATHPAERREEARLMVLPPGEGILHRRFADLPGLLRPGDLLVRNDSRVLPARLAGRRASGGAVEVLLLHPLNDGGGAPEWEALVRPGRKLREGEVVHLGLEGALAAEIGARLEGGARRVRFQCPAEEFRALLERHGRLPLPPYILRRRAALAEADYGPEDAERYQTVYARAEGSVAAPTAGLHFSPELLASLDAMGVRTAEVTLHVGAGTFQTMEPGGRVEEHQMHFEEYQVPAETADAVNMARRQGRRVIAVGTTTVRTLEAAADAAGGVLRPGSGTTSLMIAPGHRFRLVDALITNFHLPRSTLLLLVSALVGRERLLRAYKEAIAQRYRFFSYGDAMFLEGSGPAGGSV